MFEIAKVTLFLMLVCVLSAVAMALTDSQTRPIIAEQKRKAEEAARKEVLPRAEKYEAVEGEFETVKGEKEVFRGLDASGKPVGFVGTAVGKGFGGKVFVVAGVDLQGKITGVKVLSHTETPGLGNRAADPAERPIQSMPGQTVSSMWLAKDRPGQGKVDSITGVTVTSRAVTAAVREILEMVKKAGGK